MTDANKTNVVIGPGNQEITTIRIFDAPKKLVFDTYTDPELLPQWWGPRSHETSVDKMDVRSGGSWRCISHDQDGNEYAFHGVYHEILPAERLVQTFEYEGAPGNIALETAKFEETDGKTKLTIQSVFQTTEARDGMAETNMEEGASDTMDRLAELLATK